MILFTLLLAVPVLITLFVFDQTSPLGYGLLVAVGSAWGLVIGRFKGVICYGQTMIINIIKSFREKLTSVMSKLF